MGPAAQFALADGVPLEPTVLVAAVVTLAMVGIILFFVLLALEPYLSVVSLGTVDEGDSMEAETKRSGTPSNGGSTTETSAQTQTEYHGD